MVALLQPWQCAEYRSRRPSLVGPGMDQPAREVASGRASCRCCGAKIAKDVECISVMDDFSGQGNARLITLGYLHIVCPA